MRSEVYQNGFGLWDRPRDGGPFTIRMPPEGG